MRIEPEHVEAVVGKLREWGCPVTDTDLRDLVGEFDVRDDPGENRPGKFSKKSLTSKKAALAIEPRSGTQRWQILMTLRFAWQEGLTREEIADRLDMGDNSVRPRVRELIEGGHIVETDRTRKTEGGQDAVVLIAREHA